MRAVIALMRASAAAIRCSSSSSVGVLFAFFWHATHMMALGSNITQPPVTVTHYWYKGV